MPAASEDEGGAPRNSVADGGDGGRSHRPAVLAVRFVGDTSMAAAEGEKKAPPASGSTLPASSVSYIMRRAIGGEQDAITAESVIAVQRCTGEFLSLIVSEARARAAQEGRASVSYAEILGVLSGLGFKPFVDPLKSHMLQQYGDNTKRPMKRPREPPSAGDAANPAAAIAGGVFDWGAGAASSALQGAAGSAVPATAASSAAVATHPPAPAPAVLPPQPPPQPPQPPLQPPSDPTAKPASAAVAEAPVN